MDDIFSIIFFIWIAFALLEGVVRKKKIPPQTQFPTEDINSSVEPNIIEVLKNEQVKQTKQLDPMPTSKLMERYSNQSQPKQTKQPDQSSNLNFTPYDTMNAMVLSEIFSKPKAFRKR